MQIKRISEKLSSVFSKQEKTVLNHTNPFACFRGNIVTADVFDKSKNISSNKKIFQTFFNSFNLVKNKINSQRNALISFGKNIKENTYNAVEFLNNSRLVFDLKNPKKLVSLDLSSRVYSVKNLMKRDVSDLSEEFVNLLAKRGV